MKLIVELDVSESAMAIRNGTLAALVDSLSTPRMNIGSNITSIQGTKSGYLAPAETPTQAAATADQLEEEKTRIDFEAALAKKQAAAAAEAEAKAAAEKAAKVKAAKAKAAAAAAELAAAELETGTTPDITPNPNPAPTPDGMPAGYTLEAVRATLAKINKAGKTAQVKALLAEFGAAKLTEISPSFYQALLEKAAKL